MPILFMYSNKIKNVSESVFFFIIIQSKLCHFSSLITSWTVSTVRLQKSAQDETPQQTSEKTLSIVRLTQYVYIGFKQQRQTQSQRQPDEPGLDSPSWWNCWSPCRRSLQMDARVHVPVIALSGPQSWRMTDRKNRLTVRIYFQCKVFWEIFLLLN